jgi:hypothetical protein
MWISNVAAPVLCFSLAAPILRTLSVNHPFAKSLVIGIALASNLGGMTSPISSPQNIFAVRWSQRRLGRCFGMNGLSSKAPLRFAPPPPPSPPHMRTPPNTPTSHTHHTPTPPPTTTKPNQQKNKTRSSA